MKFFDFSKIVASVSRLNKREKIIFAATAMVVGVLVLDQAIIRPISSMFYSFHQQSSSLEASVKKSIRLLAQKDRMLKEVKQYGAYVATAKSTEVDTMALLKHIEELANQTSVNLLYVKPAAVRGQEQIKKYYVNLECEGQMEQIVRFFYELENSKSLLKIEKYILQPTAKGSTVIKGAATVSKALIS